MIPAFEVYVIVGPRRIDGFDAGLPWTNTIAAGRGAAWDALIAEIDSRQLRSAAEVNEYVGSSRWTEVAYDNVMLSRYLGKPTRAAKVTFLRRHGYRLVAGTFAAAVKVVPARKAGHRSRGIETD